MGRNVMTMQSREYSGGQWGRGVRTPSSVFTGPGGALWTGGSAEKRRRDGAREGGGGEEEEKSFLAIGGKKRRGWRGGGGKKGADRDVKRAPRRERAVVEAGEFGLI